MKERVVENVHEGDVIKIKVADLNGDKYDSWVVTNVYKHCVIAVRSDGIRRGISYGELVQRGLEPSYGNVFLNVNVPRTDYDLGEEENEQNRN